MTTRSIAIVLALACVTTPALADTKTDKATAKKLYEEGLRRYNVAEYTEAIRVWKEAYLISKRPLLLFNIGQAYRLSGDCTQAMSFYDSYRREEASLKNQAELDDAEALCKAKLPEKPVVDSPPTQPPPSSPEVTPPPVTETPSTQPTGGGLRKVGIVVGAVGVALGGGAIYFALDSRRKANELSGFEGEWELPQKQLEADGQRSAALGWGLGIAGIAAVGAGVVMFAIGGPSTESSGVAITPARGGAQVSWSLAF